MCQESDTREGFPECLLSERAEWMNAASISGVETRLLGIPCRSPGLVKMQGITLANDHN